MFSKFFCCSSKSASEPQIGEKITEMNKSKRSHASGNAESTAKLIKFSFETKAAEAEVPNKQSTCGSFNANHTYSHSQSVYTTDSTFVITLVFDDAGPKGVNVPKISDEKSCREVLIEHYNQETNTLIDQSKRKTVEQNIYVLDKPLGEYLKQYCHLDNVVAFLELYERANKIFTNNEAVPPNNVVITAGSLSSMTPIGAPVLQMTEQASHRMGAI
jgi:hypothetical protein